MFLWKDSSSIIVPWRAAYMPKKEKKKKNKKKAGMHLIFQGRTWRLLFRDKNGLYKIVSTFYHWSVLQQQKWYVSHGWHASFLLLFVGNPWKEMFRTSCNNDHEVGAALKYEIILTNIRHANLVPHYVIGFFIPSLVFNKISALSSGHIHFTLFNALP